MPLIYHIHSVLTNHTVKINSNYKNCIAFFHGILGIRNVMF